MKLELKDFKCILLLTFIAVIFGCENNPKSDVMLKLFNVNTSKQLIINIPESLKNQCIIDELIEVDSEAYAKGTTTMINTDEKITVIFDYNNIVAINHNDTSIFRFVAPFTVSGSGTGNFNYIGLFELNKKTNDINHSYSKFIGDRIVLDKLIYDGNESLDVIIKTYGKKQSFAETPKVTKTLQFGVTDIIHKKD